jgi:C-terminal processing protease CtpA/Prc
LFSGVDVSNSLQQHASSRRTRGLRIAILSLTLLVSLGALADESTDARPSEEQPDAWIGVWLDDAVDGGVEIVALVPGGPAHRAGLTPGDIIIEANLAEVTNRDLLRLALLPLAPGDPLELVLLRGGDSLRRTLAVDRRSGVMSLAPRVRRAPPASDAVRIAQWRTELLGLKVTEITPELRQHYGAPTDTGVLVVGKGSGDLLGIHVGDVLLSIGGRPIERAAQLAWFSRWNAGDSIAVEVVRDRQRTTLTMTPESVAPDGSDPGILDASGRSNEDRERELLRVRLEREIERLEKRLEQLRSELNKQGESRNP